MQLTSDDIEECLTKFEERHLFYKICISSYPSLNKNKQTTPTQIRKHSGSRVQTQKNLHPNTDPERISY